MGFSLPENFKHYSDQNLKEIKPSSVLAVLSLQAEGATVPFIARYRKEKTGNLNEIQIRKIIHAFENWQEVTKRKEFILVEIQKQGSLTDDLKKQIEESYDLAVIEELYRPYKRKKKTKAKMAKDAGLEPLADWIWALGQGEIEDQTDLEVKAKEFVNPAAGYVTYEEVLRGAQHIIVERITNNPELRKMARDEYFSNSKIVSQKTTKFKKNSKYEMYAEYSEPVKTLQLSKASHRYLALRRGWQEGELRVSFEVDEGPLLESFEKAAGAQRNTKASDFLKESAKTALTIHVIPSIANELHRQLKDKADDVAIQVFAENLRRVLMASPYGSKVVLGVDPGLRTGCKIALVDQGGNFVSDTVMHILGDKAEEKAKTLFEEVLKQISIQAIAVGNGTGGREAEAFIRKILKNIGQENIPVVMVNESGASVYSASEVAAEEFPQLDLTVRGAISIARRLQDPLSELVKIDPKSIGVGQYQHDVSQTHLKRSLHDVVESCVNTVGVDLNTASTSLLQYVAGVGPAIAKNIVDYRKEKGLYKDRSDLLSVPKLSSKVFEQSAGFFRIKGGTTPLDQTGIHPERYQAVKDMLQEAGISLSQALGGDISPLKSMKEKWSQLVGEYTFNDILRELGQPGRDPRDPFKVFKYREDIHTVEDLKEGMLCPGIVTNVTNFGAFVDIGVHQDGLLHISEMTKSFVNDPKLVVSPGDQVQVKVIKVDKEKKQISLSMLFQDKSTPRHKAKPAPSGKRGKNVGKKAKKPGNKGRGGKPSRPRPPKTLFNNPFDVLSQLKK